MAAILYILNGPNLNLLGTREPEVYGKQTLADIEKMCREVAKRYGFDVVFRQSNLEGELVNWVQEARTKAAGMILNAGAYTHTSIAIHDALRATTMPVVEVHLSNPYAREEFRHRSYISGVAKGVICGFGAHGYVLAIEALASMLATGKV
jgi:3-dehydroquinate dehydratase-2